MSERKRLPTEDEWETEFTDEADKVYTAVQVLDGPQVRMTRNVYMDRMGKIVPEDDPTAHHVLCYAGEDVNLAPAKKYGIIE